MATSRRTRISTSLTDVTVVDAMRADPRMAIPIDDVAAVLRRDHGKTIIMVTHDPMAARYASRLLHLDKGALLLDETREPEAA